MVLVCPMCLSPKVVLYLGGYCGKIYKCLECGYVGPLILDVDEKDLLRIKIEEELKKVKGSNEGP